LQVPVIFLLKDLDTNNQVKRPSEELYRSDIDGLWGYQTKGLEGDLRKDGWVGMKIAQSSGLG
jgi:hypothetical protein